MSLGPTSGIWNFHDFFMFFNILTELFNATCLLETKLNILARESMYYFGTLLLIILGSYNKLLKQLYYFLNNIVLHAR